MNISDFIERSNPEDMAESYEQQAAGKSGGKATGIEDRDSSIMRKNMLILSIVVLTGTASLALGILAGNTRNTTGGLLISTIPTTHPSAPTTGTLSASALSAVTINASSTLQAIPSGGEVVGDSVTHSYYLPWCKAQVAKISSSTQVWFATEPAAQSAGYKAGKGCKGI